MTEYWDLGCPPEKRTIPELSLSGTADNPAKTITIPKMPIVLKRRKGKITWEQKV
jgi:hypothetical protein